MRANRTAFTQWEYTEVIAALAFAFACNWVSIPLYDLRNGIRGANPMTWLGLVLFLAVTGGLLAMTIQDRFAGKPRSVLEFFRMGWHLKTPSGVVAGVAITIVVVQLAFDALVDLWSDCVFPGGQCKFDWFQVLAPVALVFLIRWLHHNARFPRYVDRVAHTTTKAPKPHPALVWFLSDCPAVNSLDVARKRFENYKGGLTFHDLDKDIEVLSAGADDRCVWNWEQLLRALRHHAKDGTLESLYVAASKESKHRLDLLVEFLRGYDLLKNLKIYYVEGSRPAEEIVRPAAGLIARVDGLDFENLEAVLSTIKIAVDDAGEEGAIIDITGGQKPNTAAAVLFTVNRKTRAQYVQTNNLKDVLSYDVVTEPVPSA